MSYEYVLHVDPDNQCVFRRDHALREREVIESSLGAVVVEQIEAQPGADAPGRANCRPFVPVHSTSG